MIFDTNVPRNFTFPSKICYFKKKTFWRCCSKFDIESMCTHRDLAVFVCTNETTQLKRTHRFLFVLWHIECFRVFSISSLGNVCCVSCYILTLEMVSRNSSKIQLPRLVKWFIVSSCQLPPHQLGHSYPRGKG